MGTTGHVQQWELQRELVAENQHFSSGWAFQALMWQESDVGRLLRRAEWAVLIFSGWKSHLLIGFLHVPFFSGCDVMIRTID